MLGSYLAAHGAQKLFGSFDGPGIDAAAAGFHHIGLRPGSIFARVASVSELAGGVLTATGAGDPLGPIILAGTMAVASSTHRTSGPFSAKGGYELPQTNLALALAVTGPGKLSVDRLTGRRLPTSLTRWSPPGPSPSPLSAWAWSCAIHLPSLPASSPTKDPPARWIRRRSPTPNSAGHHCALIVTRVE